MLEMKAAALLIGARHGEHLRFGIESPEKGDARRPPLGGEPARHRHGGIAAEIRNLEVIADRARRRCLGPARPTCRSRPSCLSRPSCPSPPPPSRPPPPSLPRPSCPPRPSCLSRPSCPSCRSRPHINVRRDVDVE